MGNASYRQTTGNIQQDQRNYFPIDLPKFILQSKIGDSKFLKTYIFHVDGVSVIVKVYMKLCEEDLKIPMEQLTFIWKTLSIAKYPNLLPYQMWIRSNSVKNKSIASPVYLIRQYFKSNLYDRLSTRPFFNEIEKLWIIFQLFKCLEICHEHKIIHGDIKPENVMCTSANWVILTDFSPFKPSLIPDDDPTDFKYYFDCSGHNRCYLAPERFIRNDVKPKVNNARKASFVSTNISPPLNPAMDVFSLGCLIAEIYLDGMALLDLPGMLKYVNQPMNRLDHEDSPARSLLLRIKNIHIRNVIIDMTQKDPMSRLTVSEYLNVLQNNVSITSSPSLPLLDSNTTSSNIINMNSALLEGDQYSLLPPVALNSVTSTTLPPPSVGNSSSTVGNLAFPRYFDSFLYELYLNLHWNGITPDDRINIVCQSYNDLSREIIGSEDEEGGKFFRHAMERQRLFTTSSSSRSSTTSSTGSTNNNEHQANSIIILSADPSTSSSPAKSPNIPPLNNIHPIIDTNNNNINNNIVLNDNQLLNSTRMRTCKFLDEEFRKFTKPLVCSNATSHNFDINNDKNSSNSTTEADLDQLTLRSQHLTEEIKRFYEGYGSDEPDLSSMVAADIANKASTHMYSALECKESDANVLGYISSQSYANTHDNKECINMELNDDNSVKIRPVYEGLIVIVDILHSNFRHLKYPQSKVICLVLLLRISRYCSDSIIIQRTLPLLLVGLEDQSANVRAISIRVLKSLLVLVENVSSVESNIFPLYLFQPLTRIAKDSELIVRIAFAECIGALSEISKRFLDISHIMELNKSMNETSDYVNLFTSTSTFSFQFPYDQKLDILRDQVGRWIRDLIVEGGATNPNNVTIINNRSGSSTSNIVNSSFDIRKTSIVKRMFLKDIIRLCVFFGQENTMDKLLTQLLTFLNDADWELRHAFCAQIPSICAFLGPTVTSECILPCIENTIYDVEERVIICALHSLTILIEIDLFTNHLIVDFVTKCKSLLIHPSESLRSAATQFICVAAKYIGDIDTAVFLSPILKDVLKYDHSTGIDLNETFLRAALIPKITRRTFRYALITTLNKITTTFRNNSLGNETISNTKISTKSSVIDEEYYKEINPNTEKKQLEIIQNYIELAAREINNKTMQWRNISDVQLAGGSNSYNNNNIIRMESFILDEQSRRNSILCNNAMVSSDNATSVYNVVPEQSVQSVYISHQKFGSLLFKPLSEDIRKCDVYLDNDGSKNLLMIRALFGIVIKPNEIVQQGATTTNGMIINPLTQVDGPINILNEIQESNNNKLKNKNKLQISKYSFINPVYSESLSLLKRIKALEIPPIPPDTGYLMQPTAENKIYNFDPQSRATWRPKEGVLLTSVREHTDAVNRIVVCPDQSYFASGSTDGTIKIWQTRYLDKISFPKSIVTYQQHKSPILDLTHLENSHSIASVSANGAIHIWRVDMTTNTTSSSTMNSSSYSIGADSLYDELYMNAGIGNSQGSLSVAGLSQVRLVNPAEGAVLSVSHYNSEVASLVTYATQRGGLHGWDLRAAKEAFYLPIRPELGYSTTMTIAPDRNWIATGSSKGFISLFDIRYHVPCKIWRHSSYSTIHRIASCKSSPVSTNMSSYSNSPLSNNNNGGASSSNVDGYGTPQSDGAFLFVAAGDNEAAVWGIPEGGECCKCFRSVSLDASRAPIAKLPTLQDIALPRHPNAQIHYQYMQASSAIDSSSYAFQQQSRHFSVRSILGRISHSNLSYLITAGTDRAIRFWDFSSPMRCYTVSGLEAAQPKALFDAPKLNDGSTGKLFVCYVATSPSIDKILQSQLPAKEGRGVIMPSVNSKDAILDIKNLEFPLCAIISGSKDGEIKLWR